MKSIVIKNHCLYGESISDEPQIGDKVKLKGLNWIGEIVDIYTFATVNFYQIKFADNQKVTRLRAYFELI